MSEKDSEAGCDQWLVANTTAFRALSLGRFDEAFDGWSAAVDALSPNDPCGARSAASRNNIGVACLLLARTAEAKIQLAKASDLWRQVRDCIDVMDVPVVGLSSTFHLMLSIHHLEAFKEIGRRRYVQWCDAATEITRLNALLARDCRIKGGDCDAIISSLSNAFGPRCPETNVVRHFAEDSIRVVLAPSADVDCQPLEGYRQKLSRVADDKWRSHAAPSAIVSQRIELAAHLTALCDPRLCASQRPCEQNRPPRRQRK